MSSKGAIDFTLGGVDAPDVTRHRLRHRQRARHSRGVSAVQTPIVTEISALSAHSRQVALVRWSLLAVPERAVPRREPDASDSLRIVPHAGTPSSAR